MPTDRSLLSRRDIAMAGLGICLQFSADPVRADAPGATPVVIRYLNDRGYVPLRNRRGLGVL